MYFPDLAFDTDRRLNEFVSEWYSNALKAMREPSLWTLSRSDAMLSVYRFLWLPTFRHPTCVRIAHSAEGIGLHAVTLDGLGGYDPGKVSLRRKVELNEDQWDGLATVLSKAGFWSMPTRGEDQGLDGEQLIVEGVESGKYHVVDRWSPADGEYRNLCQYMLGLAGLEEE